MRKPWDPQVLVLTLIWPMVAGCSASLFDLDSVKDKEGLWLNQQRLEVAVQDLNAIADPTSARAEGPARASGCGVDSGQVFEPEASRSWVLFGPALDPTDPESVDAEPLRATPAAQEAMERIARQLVARGWSGKTHVKHTADDIYVIDLRRDYSDHRVLLGLQGLSDSILAVATTTPEGVCNH